MDRLFLDANVLFSAAYMADARLRELWRLRDVELWTSRYALEEARVARLRRLKQLREAVAAAETARDRDAKAVEGAGRVLADAQAKLVAAEAALAASRQALAAAEAEPGR